jgi:hypothetical protein
MEDDTDAILENVAERLLDIEGDPVSVRDRVGVIDGVCACVCLCTLRQFFPYESL